MNQYLATLGLEPGVSEADIKRAYRRLAKEYHPDINSHPDAHRRFVEITEAYHVLLNTAEQTQQETYSYDYDPLARAYAEKRKRAQAFARQKRQQEAEERRRALILLYSYTNYLVGFILLFNVLLMLDYLLPARSQVERVTKMAYSFESPNQQGQNLIYRHGTIYFEEHSMRVSREISDQWANLEPVGNVHTSALLDVVLKAEVMLEGQPVQLEPVFSVYRFFFFLIPTVILLAGLYFRWPQLSENKIGIVGILFIISIIQIIIFFLS